MKNFLLNTFIFSFILFGSFVILTETPKETTVVQTYQQNKIEKVKNEEIKIFNSWNKIEINKKSEKYDNLGYCLNALKKTFLDLPKKLQDNLNYIEIYNERNGLEEKTTNSRNIQIICSEDKSNIKYQLLSQYAHNLYYEYSEFSLISWGVKEKNQEISDFVSYFAQKNKQEDFKESFLYYIYYYNNFEKQSERNNTLYQKFNFIKRELFEGKTFENSSFIFIQKGFKVEPSSNL